MNAHVFALAPASAPTEFTFHFDGKPIRGIAFADKQPVFVAADLAAALHYRDANNLGRVVRPQEKGTHLVSTPGGIQRMTTITESGLYRAIMARRIADEKDVTLRRDIDRFQDWVVVDVLPQIRRTGSYAVAPPPVPAPAAIDVRDPGQLAVITAQLIAVLDEERQAHALTHAHLEDTSRLLASETRAREVTTVALSEAHGQLDAQRPKILAHERMAATPGAITFSEAALILRVNRATLIQHLEDLRYLTRYGSRSRLRCTKEGQASGWVDQDAETVEVDGRPAFSRAVPVLLPAGLAGLGEHFCRGARLAGQPVLPGF